MVGLGSTAAGKFTFCMSCVVSPVCICCVCISRGGIQPYQGYFLQLR
jgi:hypothetical protein